MSDHSGAPSVSRWEILFDEALRIIEQANATVPATDTWSFGGGTALMLQIDHRESFDIDIFIDDPQLLPYLNPQTQGYSLEIAPSTYVSDGARVLKLVFETVGEIDFICAPGLTANSTTAMTVRGRQTRVETPAEIIAKKIFYRGATLQPRDIFDTASVIEVIGAPYLIDALTPFAENCRKALDVVSRMNPQFAEAVMNGLVWREHFSDMPQKAQAMTLNLLNAVCATQGGAYD
jgi:hypothetical protein